MSYASNTANERRGATATSQMIGWRVWHQCLLGSQKARLLLALAAVLCSRSILASPVQASQGSRLHRSIPKQAKIAVADIPERFTKGNLDALLGFASLGKVIDIESAFWESQWHEVDKWWINQLTISPMRVWDSEQADIIFVPATLRSDPGAAVMFLRRPFRQANRLNGGRRPFTDGRKFPLFDLQDNRC